MGTLGFTDTSLAYQPVNGLPNTPDRIAKWASALAKSVAHDNDGIGIVASGRHPQTGAPFVVVASATATANGKSYISIRTPQGYICINCLAHVDYCWHNAAHMMRAEPDRAAAILAEATRLAANARLDSENARKDAALLPVSRKSRRPSIYR